MVSAEDSLRNSKTNIKTHFYYYTPPPLPSSSPAISRSSARSMRTVRSNIFNSDRTPYVSENLTDSVIDIRLGELASKSSSATNSKALTSAEISDILEVSLDFSACSYSSDISGELRRLANVSDSSSISGFEPGPDTSAGFLHTEIIDSISPEDLQSTVEHSVEGLSSPSMEVKRSAAAKLRLLAKNRADNRALIGESGAIPGLIQLLRCSDPISQEHAVTALLNLSLHETNKSLITNAGAIKSLIYVLKTGTEVSKQNAACALLSLALVDENKLTIGACGAISPLVALLISGSTRGKKDALTTLYKLCSVRLNKERAVSAGAVKPLVRLVGEQGSGLAEKAMVVLSSLAAIQKGREAIVEEGGIAVLVEAIEDGSDKGKEFAVLTMSQLCAESVRNRGLLVREGGIPPLVALSQCGTPKAKHKAETLLVYLRESREEASASVS